MLPVKTARGCAQVYFSTILLYSMSISTGKYSIELCAEFGMLPVQIARGCAPIYFSNIHLVQFMSSLPVKGA
jgi:hypothetical protein